MLHSRAILRRRSILLASAVIWFVGVTLCSTEALGEDSHSDEHATTEQQAPAGAHHDDSCGCESIQSCTATIFSCNLAKAPALTFIGPVFLPAELDSFPRLIDLGLPLGRGSGTGPPERSLFTELVIQRSVRSLAPPILG